MSNTKTLLGILCILLIAAFNFFSMSDDEPTVSNTPQIASGLVLDEAGLLTSAQQEWIAQYHTAILNAYDIDFRVATTRNSTSLDGYAAKRFKKLRVGKQSKTKRGLLLAVDPGHRMVRLQMSHDLESIYTSAFVKYIQEQQMKPFFEANRPVDGIVAAVGLIAKRPGDAYKGKAFNATSVQ